MIEVRFPAFSGSLRDFTVRVRDREVPHDAWQLRPVTQALLAWVRGAAPPAGGDTDAETDPAARPAAGEAEERLLPARGAASADPGAAGTSAAALLDAGPAGTGEGLRSAAPLDFDAAADALDDLVTLIAWRRRYLFHKPRQRQATPEEVRELRRIARLALAVELERLAEEERLRRQAEREAQAAGTEAAAPPAPAALSPGRILGLLRRIQQQVLAPRAQALLEKLSREKWKVADKLSSLFGLLTRRQVVTFEQLLENRRDPDEVVVSLLAVLSAVKEGRVSLSQERHFDPIVITRRDDAEPLDPAAPDEDADQDPDADVRPDPGADADPNSGAGVGAGAGADADAEPNANAGADPETADEEGAGSSEAGRRCGIRGVGVV